MADEKLQDEKTEVSETGRGGTPAKKDRKPAEPSSFTVSNMSRVTPHQLPLISYPAHGRYQPIRPIGEAGTTTDQNPKKSSGPNVLSGGSGGAEKIGAAGSIIMLGESVEGQSGQVQYIELDRSLWPLETEARAVDEQVSEPMAVVEETEEAEMPPPFEYSFD